MLIQSETTAIVYSIKRTSMDGKQYVNVMLGNAPLGDNAQNVKGGEVMKASCEPSVFDAFPEIEPMKPRLLKMITTVKAAAQGKTAIHILSYVSDETPTPGTSKTPEQAKK